MKKIILILFSVVLIGCNSKVKKENKTITKKIEVKSNPNILTSHVIEMFVWPREYPTRPMCVSAQKYFEPYKNHPAVKLSDSLLLNEIFYFDELTEILLYLEEFPSTKFRYSLKNSPYANRTEIINEWVRKLSDFYVDADVETFLSDNQEFYNGAISEVKKNLPPENFIQLIEDYYRESKESYTIIPAPEMPTGGEYGQRGIGAYVFSDKGMLVYQVISASLPVKRDSLTNTYTTFGFDNKDFILRNSYHEFGHSFVNPIIAKEKFQNLLKNYEYLFNSNLKEAMKKQNYHTWSDCIAEHLVRLGEIRLAERSGNNKWAEELRKYHYEQLHFVFLPELEQQIKIYENDTSYPSFESYLPELLKILEKFNLKSIEKRITAHKV